MDDSTSSIAVVNIVPTPVSSAASERPLTGTDQESGQTLMASPSVQQSPVIQQSQQRPVIQAAGVQLQQQLQSMHDIDQNGISDQGPLDDEAKKRRDILSRRPSYRKILNDLSSDTPIKMEQLDEGNSDSSSDSDMSPPNSTVGTGSPAPVGIPGNQVPNVTTIQVSSADALQLQGLQAIQIPGTTQGDGQQAAVVQFTPNGQSDTQYILTTQGPGNKVQAYTIRGQIPQSMVINTSNVQGSPHHQTSLAEEAARKRELRLLKNREAAKECRRKKKEYVKCLENRVAVLENQNKALIEELKSLKDLYCNKGD